MYINGKSSAIFATRIQNVRAAEYSVTGFAGLTQWLQRLAEFTAFLRFHP